MKKTERIQYQAALAITGAWQGSRRSKLYEELGWESLSDRRWCRRILKIHKIVSDKTLSYLNNKLPRLRRPLYRQSNSNTFHELKCKSLRCMGSFFPDAITSWNNVITHLNDIPSFSVLKNHILSFIRPRKICIFEMRSYIYDVPMKGGRGIWNLRLFQMMGGGGGGGVTGISTSLISFLSHLTFFFIRFKGFSVQSGRFIVTWGISQREPCMVPPPPPYTQNLFLFPFLLPSFPLSASNLNRQLPEYRSLTISELLQPIPIISKTHPDL